VASANLTFTGDQQFVVSGSQARCKNRTWLLTGKAYPKLGEAFTVTVTSNPDQPIKPAQTAVTWQATTTQGYANTTGGTYTYSDDEKSVTLDTTLVSLDGTSTVSVTGTITCP
jgi:hypothetical protein